MRRSVNRWMGWLTGGLVAALVGPAHGHGRFPEASQIVVDPNEADRIFVQSTYGATVTRDGGTTWYWLCAESIDFNPDKEDPSLVFTGGGALVIGTFGGLTVSDDFGCDFSPVGGDLTDRFFVDVAGSDDMSRVVAVSSNGLAAFEFDVNVWASSDDGSSWARVGTQPPRDFLALSLGLAPSNDQRIYLAGRDGTDDASLEGVVMRSDDEGAAWQRFAVPNSAAANADIQILPEIALVDPQDDDKLYLRVATKAAEVVTHFELLVSDDGGDSWETVFEADDDMPALASSPDGSTIAIGGPDQGLWMAPVSSLEFTKVSDVHIGCLTWAPSGLYACTDQFKDGFIVGRSTDDGVTFESLAELDSPCGVPPSCPAGTTTADTCDSLWPTEQLELGAEDCSGGGGDGGGGEGGSSAETSSGSCGCRVVAPDSAPKGAGKLAAWFVALLAGAGLALRRN